MNREPEKQLQLNALVWKINASNEAKNTVFQNNPEIALLDTWLFTASMTDFLKDSTGNKLVKTAMTEVRGMVRDILFYVVIILIVILFIPFALGYLTGRTMGARKNKTK